ncbi:MAG: PH domain-containing protein, partial [Actinomycetota bacterium]|nr:PH domain-containing protein [Actinomycetota bacterium]
MPRDCNDVLMTFRHGAAERAAAVIWLAGSSALATARWWLAPVLLLPLLAVAAAFRRGTRVDAGGIIVSALLARRRVPWASVTEVRA